MPLIMPGSEEPVIVRSAAVEVIGQVPTTIVGQVPTTIGGGPSNALDSAL